MNEGRLKVEVLEVASDLLGVGRSVGLLLHGDVL